MKMLKTIVILALSIVLPGFAEDKDDRLLASITSLFERHHNEQAVALLETNIQFVDRIHADLISKYKKAFSKKNPKASDFNALRRDLTAFVNFEHILKKVEDNKWSPPEATSLLLSQDQKTKLQSFYDDYNNNIFPELDRGLKSKQKKAILTGLNRWSKNNRDYRKLMESAVSARKKKS